VASESHPSIPAVIYAAKSTADPRGSIPTQVDDCRAQIDQEADRVVYGEPLTDEGRSAFKGNRGEGLAAAKDAALAAAAEHGTAELWVQHSDRVARGDGITADHLAEVWFALRRGGVTMRSVQDDGNLEDAIRVVLIGERNFEDSRRKGEAVRSGLRRNFERGERAAGALPDGYEPLVRRDSRDRVVERGVRLDPTRAPVIREAFDLAEQGHGALVVARTLNERGHLTKRGARWTRRRVIDLLGNPYYAGRAVWHRARADEEVTEGRHPALIEPERFDRVQTLRRQRDPAGGARPKRGRPPTNYALAGLARCWTCGGPLRAYTSSYRRRDGSRRRSYQCVTAIESGECSASARFDAEMVDRAVVANLDRYVGDFAAWRDQIESGHAAERERIGREVAAAEVALAKVSKLTSAVEADYERLLDEGNVEHAGAVLPLLHRRRRDVDDARRRLTAAEDALATVPDDAPADAMLDFYAGLSDAIRGRLEGAESIQRVNEALRDLFEYFVLSHVEAEDGEPAVMVLPILRPETPLVVECDGAAGTTNGMRAADLEDGRVTGANLNQWGGLLTTGTEEIVPPLRSIAATARKVPESSID
jgi:hypothetical protein